MMNSSIKNEIIEFENRICWHDDFKAAHKSIVKLLSYKGRKPKGRLLIGPPGCGKTFTSLTVMNSLHKKVDTNDLTTKPCIYINVSLFSNPSQLLSEILIQLGDINPYKGNLTQKKNTAIRLFIELGVKLLIIDEFHDILPKSNILPTSQIYSFLKGFLDTCGIPFLLLGIENSQRFLEVDNQIRTRFLPTVELHAFSCLSEEEKLRFALIMESLILQLPRKTAALEFTETVIGEDGNEIIKLKTNHNMLFRLNLATEGLMRVIVDLLTECIELTNYKDTVDKDVLKVAYENVVNSNHSINPFDMSNTLSKVKTSLIRKGLYNAS